MKILHDTIEWVTIATIITFVVTYAWTGELIKSTAFTIALQLSKSIIFYFWLKYREPKIEARETLINHH